MTTTNQGLSFAEVEQIVAMRVARAIETIVIYEERTHVARDSRNQIKRQEDKVTENASKKEEMGRASASATTQRTPMVKPKIKATCSEAIKEENVENENLYGINKEFETRPGGTHRIKKTKFVTTSWRIRRNNHSKYSHLFANVIPKNHSN
ncbi:hypothetical protein Tco_0484341 [Tanacetum coccineum]